MASLLDGKKIIVTAGASGIGATTAKLMRDWVKKRLRTGDTYLIDPQ